MLGAKVVTKSLRRSEFDWNRLSVARTPTPIEGREDIAGLVCFFTERVDELTVDGVPVAAAA